MDAGVLVSIPQAWGASTSPAALSHAYVDSRAGAGQSTRQQQGSNRHSTHTALDASPGRADVSRRDNDRNATALPTSSSSSNSSSAFADLSGAWAATADDVESALPGPQLLFEPLDVSSSRRASYRDQHQRLGSMQAVAVLPRYASNYHRSAVPIPAAPAINRSRSTGSSSSSSGSSSSSPTRFQRLQRHSSSAGGFLSATASQLLGALSGISLMSSSSTGSTSSRRAHRVRSSSSGVRGAVRGSIIVRGPALLDLDSPTNYDDLLALDQFNVKRAVKPSTLASLPNRGPNAEDLYQQRHCFICLENWQQGCQQGSPGLDVEPLVDQDGCGCCGVCQVSGSEAADWQQQQLLYGGYLADIHRQHGTADQSPSSTHNAAKATCRGCSSSSNGCSTTQSSRPFVNQAIPVMSSKNCSPTAVQQQQCDVLIQQLPCGHEFCAACICNWLKDHATCPVCRWAFADEDTQLINIGK